MKKEEFKEFVKNNPSLVKYVKNNEMTWQKFYELYDLYGDDSNVWDEYIKKENIEEKVIKPLSFGEILNFLKNVDLDSLQESIGNVQRVLGVVQDFSNKNNNIEENTYKPRPLYKHFED